MTTTLSPLRPDRRAAVRSLLVQHATETPNAPSPAARRRPPVWRIAGVTTAAVAVAVTATLLVAADPAAPPSYATWSAVPQTSPSAAPDSDEIAEWASKCTDLGVGGVAVEGVKPGRAAAQRRSVLVDRRGRFTYCVDVAPGRGTAADPLVGLSGIRDDDGLSRMWTTVSDKPLTAPAGDDVLVLGGDLTSPPPEPKEPGVVSLEAYQLYGLAGPAVDGVVIVLADGLRVTATVHDGLWGAWWPTDRGDPAGATLEITAQGGSRTVPASELALRV